MLSVINQAYYPFLLADATAKNLLTVLQRAATFAHSKPGMAHLLGIWGLYRTPWLEGGAWNLFLKG